MNTFKIGMSVLVPRTNIEQGNIMATITEIDSLNRRLRVRWYDNVVMRDAEKWILFEDAIIPRSSNDSKM